MSNSESRRSSEEIPLEIQDYSCTNCFEDIVNAVEDFLTDSFSNCEALQEFRLCAPKKRPATASPPPLPSSAKSSSDDISLFSFTPSDDDGSGVMTHDVQNIFMASGGTTTQAPTVMGRSFSLSRRRGSSPNREAVGAAADDMCVEIHCHDYDHPIARQFCLPLFLLAKAVAQQATYRPSESNYYLSILATAAGNALSGSSPLAIKMGHAEERALFMLPSPYMYYPGCVPCFAPSGDSFQRTFVGVSPPCSSPSTTMREDGGSRHPYGGGGGWGATNNHNNSSSSHNTGPPYQQAVLSTRFQCSAYAKPPAGCEHLSDFIDLFQVQLGQRTRMHMDDFEGMCISVRKLYALRTPWRFRVAVAERTNNNNNNNNAVDAQRRQDADDLMLTWDEVLRRENKLLAPLCGQSVHPFGTAAAPLHEIQFSFQWNQLHDFEAQESASKSFLNPFALKNTPAAREVNRKCSITAQAIMRPDSEITSGVCGAIRGFVNQSLEHMHDCGADVFLSAENFAGTASSFVKEEWIETILLLRAGSKTQQRCSVQETLIQKFSELGSPSSNNNNECITKLLLHPPGSPSGHESGSNGAASRKDLRDGYFPGSLLSRFAHLCVQESMGPVDASMLWKACMVSLKKQFDRGGNTNIGAMIDCIAMPVREPAVDLNQTLLVQKLQLLSYCLRAMLLHSGETGPHGMRRATDGWDEDEEDEMDTRIIADEVLLTDEMAAEAHADVDVDDDPLLLGSDPDDTDKDEDVNDGGRGRVSASPLGPQQYLITHGEPLLHPPHLPHPPATADVIMQRAKKLNDMGSSAVARATRTWLQSDSLYNDMCLFLHTNQAHTNRVVRFPDFIQWHSPRDFVVPSVGSSSGSHDDNAYLSERMQKPREEERSHGGGGGGSAHVWWALWDRAVPRSRAQIIADSFHPYEEAVLVFRWLEQEVTHGMLLLETINAALANALHPMLCHRFLIQHTGGSSSGGIRISSSEQQRCDAVNNALRSHTQHKVHSITTNALSAVTMWANLPMEAFTEAEFEIIISQYSLIMRELGEVELALCGALTIEHMLGRAQPSAQPTITALSSPLARQTDVAGVLQLHRHAISLSTWASLLAPRFDIPKERVPRDIAARLTCVAERPINTAGCFQQLYVERDSASDVLRMALALSKELEAIRAAREAKQRIVEQYQASPTRMASASPVAVGTSGVSGVTSSSPPPPAAAAAATTEYIPPQPLPAAVAQQRQAAPRPMHRGLDVLKHWKGQTATAPQDEGMSSGVMEAVCALSPLVCLVDEGRAAVDVSVTTVLCNAAGSDDNNSKSTPSSSDAAACIAVAYSSASTSGEQQQQQGNNFSPKLECAPRLEGGGYPWGTTATVQQMRTTTSAAAMPDAETVAAEMRRAAGVVLAWVVIPTAASQPREESPLSSSSSPSPSMRHADDPSLTIVTPLLCESEISCLVAHPFQSGVLIAGTRSGQIVMWSVAAEWSRLSQKQLRARAMDSTGSTATLIWRPQRPSGASFPSPHGHLGPIIRLSVHGDSSCHHLYSVSEEGRVCTWATNRLQQPVAVRSAYLGTLPMGHVGTAAAFVKQKGSDAMTRVYIGTSAGQILQGTNRDSRVVELKACRPHTNGAASLSQPCARIVVLALQPDGFREASAVGGSVAAASLDGACTVWMGSELSGGGIALQGGITALQWSPTHPSLLAAGNADGVVTLWNLVHSVSAPTASMHVHSLTQLHAAGATAASAAVLALTSRENTSLAAANLTAVHPPEDVAATITAITFSSDGEWLFAGTASGSIFVLKLNTQLLRPL